MTKSHVELSEHDHKQLIEMLEKGSLKSRIFKRITALLELHKGKTYRAVKNIANLSANSLIKLAKRYADEGLECLHDKPRSGRPKKFEQKDEDEVIKLACSKPPAGHEYWSIRLIADKMVELKYCDEISRSTVHNIVKKKKIKPHLVKIWCIGKINAEFLARMENILQLYRLPYDERFPLICFDERPCFLIGDVIEGLGLSADQARKIHYEYEKNGSCRQNLCK